MCRALPAEKVVTSRVPSHREHPTGVTGQIRYLFTRDDVEYCNDSGITTGSKQLPARGEFDRPDWLDKAYKRALDRAGIADRKKYHAGNDGFWMSPC